MPPHRKAIGSINGLGLEYLARNRESSRTLALCLVLLYEPETIMQRLRREKLRTDSLGLLVEVLTMSNK